MITTSAVATVTVVTGAVMVSSGATSGNVTGGDTAPVTATSVMVPGQVDVLADRVLRVSRDHAAPRPSLTRRSVAKAVASGQVREIRPKVVDTEYATTALNVWTGPGERFTFLSVLGSGTKVSVTSHTNGLWRLIIRKGEPRWVRSAYLSDQKPRPEPKPVPVSEVTGSTSSGTSGSSSSSSSSSSSNVVSGISAAPCASGSSVESGLTSDAIRVHRAVCARYPEVTAYGGVRSDGEHGTGQAIDIMISGSTGTSIADWVRANSSALGVSEVLWAQQIWTVQRGSEGWRPFEDRGSTTANHYDHVHVTVYGSSGSSGS